MEGLSIHEPTRTALALSARPSRVASFVSNVMIVVFRNQDQVAKMMKLLGALNIEI